MSNRHDKGTNVIKSTLIGAVTLLEEIKLDHVTIVAVKGEVRFWKNTTVEIMMKTNDNKKTLTS
jgi:hypothetical protein